MSSSATLRSFADLTFGRPVAPDGETPDDDLALLGPSPGDGEPALGADDATVSFAEAAAGTLLFCHDAKAWFTFDGAVWRRDRVGLVTRKIRAALREHGAADSRRVAAVDSFARTEAALATGDRAWDADPWLLGTPGGTVDLATGTLRPADPDDRITRATAVAPAPTSDCPRWLRFLDQAMDGDQDRVLFLHRFLGYALTGDTREHSLVYGLGDGGTGKSVFVNTVRAILGDYAMVAAPDLFAQGAERRAGQGGKVTAHSTEVAMLAGARLVTASETEEGRHWAEGRLKLLTGGDPVTARYLGRDHFTFTPRFKLLVVGNHMPLLRTVDDAIRRRLLVVPFDASPAMPNPLLDMELLEEGPAILRWMIEGCVAWRSHGLARPRAVCEASTAYFRGQDIVAQFLYDRCERDPAHEDPAGTLYQAWCAYTKAVGEPAGTARSFGAALERHGFTRERTAQVRVYRGLRLR